MKNENNQIYEKIKNLPSSYTEIVHEYKKDQLTCEAVYYLKKFIDNEINKELYMSSLLRRKKS